MIGSGRETMSGLAAGLSASEDRDLLTQLNVDVDFASSPSFETTAAGSINPTNSGAVLAAMHSFESNLMGLDDALEPTADGVDEGFLDANDPILKAVDESQGVPWPTPWTEPSDWGFSGTHGWDGQKGSDLSGFEGGIYLESLQGLDVAPSVAGKNTRKAQFKTVLVAGMQPGTKLNRDVTKKLLEKSMTLGKLAEKRAIVTSNARKAFEAHLSQVQRNDKEVNRLYNLVFDAAGKIKPGASDSDLKKLLALRKKNIELGRDTVRLQKVNMLASAITGNTLTQLTTVQNMAQAVASGAPEALPAMGLAFDKLGRENAKIRQMREKQRENWGENESVKFARAEAGMEGFDGLYGLDALERPFDEMEHQLAALEWSFKKAVKSAAKSVSKTVKKASNTVKNVAKETGKVGSSLVKAAVIAPTKGTIQAAKAISKGNVKGAFKAVGSSVVDSAKNMKDVAARTVLKWGCDIANTKAFKTAVQITGQAVGSAVGTVAGSPTIGGAIGKEAGNQAANTQRNTCGAMKTIGLTDGKFKPGKIDDAAKTFAKQTWNETLSPKAQLASLKRVASNAMGGQLTSAFNVGGVDVMKKVGLDPNKLVSSNPLVQDLYKRGTSKLQSAAQKQFTKATGSLLQKTGIPGVSKLTPAIQSVIQGGRLPNVNIKQITEQGSNLLRQQAATIARRQAGAAITRMVPRATQFLPQAAAGLVRSNISQAQLLQMARQQIAPATVEQGFMPPPMVSRFISQATEEALPYVGSIGRDF